MNRKTKWLGFLSTLILLGCNAMPTPILPPDGMQIVVGGIADTRPYLGTFAKSEFTDSPIGEGTFLLASCGCGYWRALFKPNDGSAQKQFIVDFYSDGDYLPSGEVTAYGNDPDTELVFRGMADQDNGLFSARMQRGNLFGDISATRGDAHNTSVEACGMCHLGDNPIYPLPDYHPPRYKSDPLSCLECHTVNGG